MAEEKLFRGGLITLSLVAVALAAVAGCRGKVDEAERIRQRIKASAAAASERDLNGVLEWIAKDFKGQVGGGFDDVGGGEIDKRQLRFLLMRYVGRGTAPTVLVRSVDVELKGVQAHASVMAMVRKAGGAGPRGATTPTRGDLLRIECDLERRDGEWWIVYAERKSVEATEFLLGE